MYFYISWCSGLGVHIGVIWGVKYTSHAELALVGERLVSCQNNVDQNS